MTSRSSLIVALLPVAVAVCYRPTLVDCTVTCQTTRGCPSPLRCVDGYCTRGASCPAHGDGGPETMSDATDGDVAEVPDDMSDASEVPDRAPCNRPEVPLDQLPTAVTGIVLWLDPEMGVSLTPTLRWYDRSPVHADATATGGAAPSFVPAADCDLPVFEFSGAGQFLTLPDGMQDVRHIFVVAEPRAALAATSDAATPFSDYVPLVHFSNGSRINEIRYEVNASQILYASFPNNSSPYQANFVLANNYTGQMQLFEVRIPNQIPDNPISVAHFKNGVFLDMVTAISAANTVMRMRNFIGHTGIAGEPDFHGRLGEVLIYNHALLDSERTKVLDYLLAKWNLPRP